jgi:hypothetical protein
VWRGLRTYKTAVIAVEERPFMAASDRFLSSQRALARNRPVSLIESEVLCRRFALYSGTLAESC